MNQESLIALIHKHGLAEQQDALLAATRPAVLVQLGQAEIGKPGQSRIGGVPDLPAVIPWPIDTRLHAHLCFLVQINFAELPTFPDNHLPKVGMLYLFAAEHGNAAEQLIMYTGSERLHPTRAPNDVRPIADYYDELVPHLLTFELIADIPRWATQDYLALCERLPTQGEDILDDLGRALSANSVGKLLGHAAGIGHDPREDAYVVREVNPEWLYNYERRSGLDMTNAQNWHNLLEIESSQAANLMFGDAGYLQILIHGDDLKHKDFSRVYVNLESS